MFAGNQIQSYRSVIKTLLQKQQTFLVLHISIWGVEAFFGRLGGDGTEFWAPVTACPPNWGYGVRLIRFCLQYYKCEDVFKSPLFKEIV